MVKINRNDILDVLKGADAESDVDVYKAVLNLRKVWSRGDEKLLLPMLHHSDAMVAAAALKTLGDLGDVWSKIKQLTFELAHGDVRDSFEMPLQCQAIQTLARMAAHDEESQLVLRGLAEDIQPNEAVACTLWKCLADVYNVRWSRDDAEAVFTNPQSESSLAVYERIRSAFGDHNS